jgi:isoamylase
MLKPSLAANIYTVMDRASVVIRAEPLPYVAPPPPSLEEAAAGAAAGAAATLAPAAP